MKTKITKILLILSTVTVILAASGCGARGELYHPNEPQSTEK